MEMEEILETVDAQETAETESEAAVEVYEDPESPPSP